MKFAAYYITLTIFNLKVNLVAEKYNTYHFKINRYI